MNAKIAIRMSSQSHDKSLQKNIQNGFQYLGYSTLPDDLKDNETCLYKVSNGKKLYIAVDQNTGNVRPIQI